MNLGTADFVLLTLIGVSTVIGLFRGLFREAFSLLVWAAALVIAYASAPALAPMIGHAVGSDAAAHPLAMVVVFIACIIIGALLQRFGAALIDTTGLSGLDRLLGMAFGAVRGVIVGVVVLIALRPFMGNSPWWQESVVIGLLLTFEHVVLTGVQSIAAHISGWFH